jgi:L-fucono-1,5-lactonase
MSHGRRTLLALCSFLFVLGVSAVVALPRPLAAGKGGAIVDTHIHTWQATRPGGIPWPPPANKQLFRDIPLAEYETVAKKNGVIASGIMEASNVMADNFKILDEIKTSKFYTFYVAELEVGSTEFITNLDKLAVYPKFVGIRGFLWSPPAITLDEQQVAHLKELAMRGMTLDIISRGTLNPKDKVDALAAAVPNLKIIIDHLAGAKGKTPAPEWVAAMEKLSKRKNLYIKFSSFYDMFNPGENEDNPWNAPTDLASYKPHFDVLMKNFGADRLIFGSNWPVVTMGGTYEGQIALAEEYLKPLGAATRDKVMYKNAQRFYHRSPK